MADYDLEEAFEAIENELINSMIRNMEHHRVEEIEEGFEWTQWQAEELRSLEAYRKSNRKKYNKKFKEINEKIEYGIRKAHGQGRMDEEIRILEAIKKGFVTAREPSAELQGSFFGVNDRKLDALVEATMHDMKKAETAMLRMADDQYRKTIFNAQVYANTGAGTYEQTIDMATKDFRARGINCIEYRNGARVNIASYAAMAIRTANTRAYLQGEGTKRQEWGISTVIVGRREHACLKCLKWVGKVLIDDVWSGGKKDDGPYTLMSTAMVAGLYHPNCKDTHTTYFPGISEEPKPLTRQEVEDSKAAYMREQEINYANRQKDKFKRLAAGALDPGDKAKYQAKAKEWRIRAREMEESRKHPELELNKETLIKFDYKSKAYYEKILKMVDGESEAKSVFRASKEILKHRNGTNFEDLCYIDSITGKTIINKDYDYYDEKNRISMCKANNSMLEMLESRGKGTVIAIHNHPRSGAPSISDIFSASDKKYKYGIVLCHDSNIYKYTVHDKLVEEDILQIEFYLDNLEKCVYNKDEEGMRQVLVTLNTYGVEMEVSL